MAIESNRKSIALRISVAVSEGVNRKSITFSVAVSEGVTVEKISNGIGAD